MEKAVEFVVQMALSQRVALLEFPFTPSYPFFAKVRKPTARKANRRNDFFSHYWFIWPSLGIQQEKRRKKRLNERESLWQDRV